VHIHIFDTTSIMECNIILCENHTSENSHSYVHIFPISIMEYVGIAIQHFASAFFSLRDNHDEERKA